MATAIKSGIEAIGKPSKKVSKAVKAAAQSSFTTMKPFADRAGWILCAGDRVNLVPNDEPNRAYQWATGTIAYFHSGGIACDVQPEGKAKLLPSGVACYDLRWEMPTVLHHPTAPKQLVRVVVGDMGQASEELKSFDGQLAWVESLEYVKEGLSLVTVKFKDAAFEPWPAIVYSTNLLVVPIPVVQYVPEPVAEAVPVLPPPIEEESDLPWLNKEATVDADEPLRLTTAAWDLLEIIVEKGGYLMQDNATTSAEITELSQAGLIALDTVANGTTYRATKAGASFIEVPEEVVAVAPVANASGAEFRNIPLEQIAVTRNTRQVFDETALAELAQSIRERGVIAPIVVRTWLDFNGGHVRYELVAGERRLRASKLAGLDTIPAMVRVLDDRAFIEVQLLENLQRVDVRPSDEAQAFAELLNKHQFSAEEIALKVGKPVKFVLQRAKLVALIPFWMELLEADRLPLVAAHELARLPPHSQVVVKKWMESSYSWQMKQNTVLDASNIRHAINQEVMRQLSSVAFPKDDATLCPGVGPCTTCPKNSANNQGLFEDLAVNNVAAKCLDAACFADKKQAFLDRRKKEVAGTGMAFVSSSYASPPAGALGYKFYEESKEGAKGAVAALMVDGTNAGATVWVKLSNSAPDAATVAQDRKAEKDASIRVNRVKKMTNELLADELRDTFTEELFYTDINAARPAARALLGHWLRNAFTFGRTRTPNDTLSYLVKQYGWAEPTEADLVNNYSDTENPHKKYINQQLNAMPSLLHLVALFFDLKIRDGLDQTEYTSNQANLVKALPKRYQADFDVTAQAEERVEQRYYIKKTKGATA